MLETRHWMEPHSRHAPASPYHLLNTLYLCMSSL
jgi:hypothetical protein